MRKLICLIGTSGAGKSSCARILESQYGFTFFKQRDFIRNLKSRFEQKTNLSLSYNEFLAALSLSNEKGFNYFVSKWLMAVESDLVVWESCLNSSNLDGILSQFDEVYFLNVVAPFETRVQRVLKRDFSIETSPSQVEERLFIVDQYEMSLGLGNLMVLSDWVINSCEGCDLGFAVKNFIECCKPTSVDYKLKNLSFSLPELKDSGIDFKPLKAFIEEYGVL